MNAQEAIGILETKKLLNSNQRDFVEAIDLAIMSLQEMQRRNEARENKDKMA